MKLNLEDINVFEGLLTVDQIRASFDGEEMPEDYETLLDNAQGHVHTGESEVAYIVIKVTR